MMLHLTRLITTTVAAVGNLVARNPPSAGYMLALLVLATVVVMVVVGVGEIVQAILALGLVIISIMLAAGHPAAGQ